MPLDYLSGFRIQELERKIREQEEILSKLREICNVYKHFIPTDLITTLLGENTDVTT